MNEVTDVAPSFREEQRFRQPWLWVLLFGCALGGLFGAGTFIHGMIRQFIYGQPWGGRPMSDTGLAVVGAVAILCCLSAAVGAPWLLYAVRLVAEVRDDGLYVRFFPFRGRTIAFDRIRHCEARTYRPILEYGGWGIRWGLRGKAYNVSGNRGVQLDIAGEGRLLIGSQRADELARAIQARIRERGKVRRAQSQD
jgi:hypothetical protein